ncbi:hypothetical protein BESB_083830 [Besnoitia besnoiti]|uniref:HEAT repeat-containing protein n=1 Tax=Besnoitia besnoiti TaxID=94643 RepID=A0A2A9M7M6_BESBE|nr:hypothetical protein BESB_083830 [Besnoitia besnoiti]PFH33184.1 hypothetical protein BESB_083830 [Besnoitia besnoiti]
MSLSRASADLREGHPLPASSLASASAASAEASPADGGDSGGAPSASSGRCAEGSAAAARQPHPLLHAVASWDAFTRLVLSQLSRPASRRSADANGFRTSLAPLLRSLPVSSHRALWLSVVRLVRAIRRPSRVCAVPPAAAESRGPAATFAGASSEERQRGGAAPEAETSGEGGDVAAAEAAGAKNADAVLFCRFSALVRFVGAFVDSQLDAQSRKKRWPQTSQPEGGAAPEASPVSAKQAKRATTAGAAGAAPGESLAPPEADGGYAPPLELYVVASFLKNNCFRLRPPPQALTPDGRANDSGAPRRRPQELPASAVGVSSDDAAREEEALAVDEPQSITHPDEPENNANGESREARTGDPDAGVGASLGAGRASGREGDSQAAHAGEEELRLLQGKIGEIVTKLVVFGLLVSVAPAVDGRLRRPCETGEGAAEGQKDHGEIQLLPLPARQSFVLSAVLHHLQGIAAATLDDEELRQRVRAFSRFVRRPHVAASVERALAAAGRLSATDRAGAESRGGREARRDVLLEKVLLLLLLLLQPPRFALLQDDGAQRLVASWWGRHKSLRQLLFNNLLGALEDEGVAPWQLEILGKFFFLAVRLSLASAAPPLTIELQQLLRACVSSPLPLAHRCRICLAPFFQTPSVRRAGALADGGEAGAALDVVSLADVFLWRSLKSPNWRVRFNAVCLWQLLSSSSFALQQQHPEYFLATLKQTLEDPSPSVRLASAAFLSSLLRRCCTTALPPPAARVRPATGAGSCVGGEPDRDGVWLLSPAVFPSLLDFLLSAAADKSAPLVRVQAILAVMGAVASPTGATAAEGFAAQTLQAPGGRKATLQLAAEAGHAAAREAILQLAPRLSALVHDIAPSVRLAAAMLLSEGERRGRGAAEQRAAAAEEAPQRDEEQTAWACDLWGRQEAGEAETQEKAGPARLLQDQVWARCTRDFLIGLLSEQHADLVSRSASSLATRRSHAARDPCLTARALLSAGRLEESHGSPPGKASSGDEGDGPAGDESCSAPQEAPADPDCGRKKRRASPAVLAAATVRATGDAEAGEHAPAALWDAREKRKALLGVAPASLVHHAADLPAAGPMEVSRHLATGLLSQLFEAPLQEQVTRVKRLAEQHTPLLYAVAAHVDACACAPPRGAAGGGGPRPPGACASDACLAGVSYVDRCKLGVALFAQVRAEVEAYEAAKTRARQRRGPAPSGDAEAEGPCEAGEPEPCAAGREGAAPERAAPWYRGSLLVAWQARLALAAQLLRPHCRRRDNKLLREQPLLRRFLVNSIREDDLLVCLRNRNGAAVLQYSFWSFFVSLPSCVLFPPASTGSSGASPPPIDLSPASLLAASASCAEETHLPPSIPPTGGGAPAPADVAQAPVSAGAPPLACAYGGVMALLVQELSRFLDGWRCASVSALGAYTAAHVCHAVTTPHAASAQASLRHAEEALAWKTNGGLTLSRETPLPVAAPSGRGRGGTRVAGLASGAAGSSASPARRHRGMRRLAETRDVPAGENEPAQDETRAEEEVAVRAGVRRRGAARARAFGSRGGIGRSPAASGALDEAEQRCNRRRVAGEGESAPSGELCIKSGKSSASSPSQLDAEDHEAGTDGARRGGGRASFSSLPAWLRSRAEAEIDAALFVDVLLPFVLREPRLRAWFLPQLWRRLLPLVATLEQQRQLLEPEASVPPASRRMQARAGGAESGRLSVEEMKNAADAEGEGIAAGPAPPLRRSQRVAGGGALSLDKAGEETGTRTTRRRNRRTQSLASDNRPNAAAGAQQHAEEASGDARRSRAAQKGERADPQKGEETDEGRAEDEEAESETSEEDLYEEEREEDDPNDGDFELGAAPAKKRRGGASTAPKRKKRKVGVSASGAGQDTRASRDTEFESRQQQFCETLRRALVPRCLALSRLGLPVEPAPAAAPQSSGARVSLSSVPRGASAAPVAAPALVAALEIVALLRHLPGGRESLVAFELPSGGAYTEEAAGGPAEASGHGGAPKGSDEEAGPAPWTPCDVLLHASVAFLRALRELLRRPAFHAPIHSSLVRSLLGLEPLGDAERGGGSPSHEDAPAPDAPQRAEEELRLPLPLEIFVVAAHSHPISSSRRRERTVSVGDTVLTAFPRERLALQRYLFKRALDLFCGLGQLVAVCQPPSAAGLPAALWSPTLVELSNVLAPLSAVAAMNSRGKPEGVAASVPSWLASPRHAQDGEATPESSNVAAEGPLVPRCHQMSLPISEGSTTDARVPSGLLYQDTGLEAKAAALKPWRRNVHLVLEIYGVVCEHLAFFFSVPVNGKLQQPRSVVQETLLSSRIMAGLPALLEAMFAWVDVFGATSNRLSALARRQETAGVENEAAREKRGTQPSAKKVGGQEPAAAEAAAHDEVASLIRMSWNSGARVGHAVCDFWQDVLLQNELGRRARSKRSLAGGSKISIVGGEGVRNLSVSEAVERSAGNKNAAPAERSEVPQQADLQGQPEGLPREEERDAAGTGGEEVNVATEAAGRQRERARDSRESEWSEMAAAEESAIRVLRVLLLRGVSGGIETAKLASLMWRFLGTFPESAKLRRLLRELASDGSHGVQADGLLKALA